MRGLLAGAVAAFASFVHLAGAQQYMGDPIQNSLPGVVNSEIAFWKIKDGKNNNVTLINYMSHGSNGQRLVPANIKRVVIIIHGLNQDPGTYEANMLSALSQVTDPSINFDNVAIVAPYFANGDNKNVGYPWVDGLAAGRGSISNCLVWKASQWSAGGNNQYPYFSTNISSYTVLDQMIQYFDNVTMFPNMHQIVIAGHSLGGQTVQRYAALGQPLNTHSPVTYWVANPNSYVWLSTSRPLPTASCSIYDNYREGYTNFSSYPMTYGLSLVNSGRANILANYNSKAISYARGTQDLGDDASTCAAETTGANRNERFFNFIKAFPPSCSDPTGRSCDTVDFVNAGHDGGAMMASPAGLARLFQDNFNGNGSRAFDFGYPRQQQGDDPYPNPALNASTSATNNNTYAGNMTYWGCWSDQTSRSLTNMTYDSTANTVELCTAACAQGNNTIAGLEFGSQCFCGNSLGYQATQVIESSCQTPCPGNSSETCGGQNRLSLFSAGRPPINSQPGTPETVGTFYYTNCYTESTAGRALSGASTAGSFVSLEYCANFCSGFRYFGTEYADECYCGNSLGVGANITSANDCNMICAGSNSEFCGAGNRLTVYVDPNWVQGTSSSVSSTTAAATPSGTASTSTGVSCPASNNTIVTSYGQNFTIECGIDHQAGDLTSLTVSSFQQCIDACSQNSQCVDVSLSGSACYLKSVLGAVVPSGGIWGAKLISSASSSSTSSVSVSSSSSASSASAVSSGISNSPSASASTSLPSSSSSSPSATPSVVACPSSNSTTYTTNGQNFLIECGIDHQGGDMASQAVTSFGACIDLCATTPNCVDVSLSGAMCYMKSTLGAPVSNGVFGAKLLGPASTSSVVQSSSSASSSPSASSVVSSTSSAISSSSSVSSSSSGLVSSTSAPLTSSVASSSSTVASSVQSDSSSSVASSSSTSSVQSTSSPTLPASSTSGVDSSTANVVSSTSSVAASTSSALSSSSSSQSSSSVASSVSSVSPSTSSGSSSSSTSGTASASSSSAAQSSSSSVSSSSSASASSLSTASPTTLSTVTVASSASSTSSASATPTVLRCPASNNTVYTAPAGQNFLIECGIDHVAGDLSMVYVSNFTQCVNTCGTTTGCVDVSLSGSACYMKKALGAAKAASGILGAKLIVNGA